MILVAEVLGVVLALTGSYVLSKKPNKLLGALPWLFFIVADMLHAVVYLNNEQNGMVFNQVTGIALCGIGLFQYLCSDQKQDWTNKITSLMLYLFWIFIASGTIMFFALIVNFSMQKLEWMLAMLAISGTTLIASRHNKAKYVYPLWIACDSVFLILCLMNEQYAIAVLRLVFICVNINGCKNWIFEKDISIKKLKSVIKQDFAFAK